MHFFFYGLDAGCGEHLHNIEVSQGEVSDTKVSCMKSSIFLLEFRKLDIQSVFCVGVPRALTYHMPTPCMCYLLMVSKEPIPVPYYWLKCQILYKYISMHLSYAQQWYIPFS